MTVTLLIVGIIILVTGILLIVKPDILVKISEVMNRSINIDDIFYSRNVIFGVMLVIVAIYIINAYLTL